MGSYDHVHDGRRCGQTKAWGKRFRELVPGSPVVLHAQLSGLELVAAEGGSSVPAEDLAVAGRARPEVRDHQVVCDDGSVLVVADGRFVAWADEPLGGLVQVGNDGRPYDGRRPAWAGPSGDCPVCAELR